MKIGPYKLGYYHFFICLGRTIGKGTFGKVKLAIHEPT